MLLTFFYPLRFNLGFTLVKYSFQIVLHRFVICFQDFLNHFSGTFTLAGFPLGFFHSHRSRRFPRSELKPMLRSRRLHAGHHLDSKQVSSRLIPGQRPPPGFDDIPTLSTLYQPLTCVLLRSTHLTESRSAFSLTLTTTAFDRSSLRWFEASACTAVCLSFAKDTLYSIMCASFWSKSIGGTFTSLPTGVLMHSLQYFDRPCLLSWEFLMV